MSEIAFLRDLVVLFSVSIVVVYFFDKLGLPAVVGFLIAGAMVGPYGLDFVQDVSHVDVFAEIGVVLFLFTIGVEFSLAHVPSLRAVLGSGLLQIGSTIALSAAAGLAFGLQLNQGIFWGFLTAMSSTAIVLKMIADRGEMNSPHGRLSTGILIVQDFAVLPMMLLTPVLAHQGGSAASVVWSLGKAIILVTVILITARFLVPWILERVVRSRSRELFLITIVLICLGIAWLSSLAGLSLALGAFIAGLILSESEYSHQAMAEVLPFRYGFNSLFFIAIGMLFNFRVLLAHPVLVTSLVLVMVIGKSLMAAGAAIASGYAWRPAILMGMALAQVGEFSFILSKVGKDVGLLSLDSFQLFLAVSVLTLLLTPFLIEIAPRIARRAELQLQLRERRPHRPLRDERLPAADQRHCAHTDADECLQGRQHDPRRQQQGAEDQRHSFVPSMSHCFLLISSLPLPAASPYALR